MATPRKPRTTKPPVVLPDGVIVLDEENAEPFQEKEPLFAIGGTVYEARTTFAAGESITYSQVWRSKGPDAAMEYAMVQALGEEGYRAFVGYPNLSRETAGRIVTQVLDRIAPQAAGPKSTRNGSSSS